ncbi:MAG: hypothetical protein R3Y50_00005 [Rikenellaceae bacterium]
MIISKLKNILILALTVILLHLCGFSLLKEGYAYNFNEISEQKVSADSIIPIIDYSDDKIYSLMLAQAVTQTDKRNVRVAFVGDSYIEGDILTMDVREMLQDGYGGFGLGFMPITSVAAKFQGTAKHTFSSDWTTKFIARSPNEGRYLLSGTQFLPKEGSWVSYSPTSYKEGASKINKATLIFTNSGNSRFSVVVNGEKTLEFNPSSADTLQSITIHEDKINSIKFQFYNVEGLTVYGALLDGSEVGVSVDNFSIRGNSGINMSYSDKELIMDSRKDMRYDLVVLEYGLNVCYEGRLNYSSYTYAMKKAVERVKECYPESAILIMGVSERAFVKDGVARLLEFIPALEKEQRKMAEECKVMYWNTFDAMQTYGGVLKFVENGWAAKDHIHINVTGGKMLAAKLNEAILQSVDRNRGRIADTNILESISVSNYPNTVWKFNLFDFIEVEKNDISKDIKIEKLINLEEENTSTNKRRVWKK